jgi:hypothetical protein
VEHDGVGEAAGQLQRLLAHGHQQQRDVLVELGVLVEERVRAGRALVAEDHVARPQPAQDAGHVLHLGARHLGQADGLEQGVEAAAEAEGEAAARQAVHGRGERRRHQRVAGVVVGGRRGDAEALGDGADGPRQHGGVLDVEPLRDERRADPEPLGVPGLAHGVAWRVGVAGERVEAELVAAFHRWSPWRSGSRRG